MSRIAELRARFEAIRVKPDKPTVPTVEELFTSPDYFGITKATSLQRAVCRIADGLPLGGLAYNEHVQLALSSWTDSSAKFDPDKPLPVPTAMVYLAGTRCGKTRFSMALAVRMALKCDLSHLELGEIPRVPIVSLSKDLAKVAYSQLSTTCQERPKLAALLVEKPHSYCVLLRHPSGRPVEIMITAGAKSGGSLVARWVPGVIFDEAPRMLGSSDGAVVNLSDMRTAVQSRLLPGAIALEVGSPWAPFGPVYETTQEFHGKPSDGTVVVRAKGWWLNPSWWTAEKRKEMAASKKTEVRLALQTDGEAVFVTPEENMYPHDQILAATRQAPVHLPPERGLEYVATMDPATRGNGWTLVVAAKLRTGKLAVVYANQWIGTKDEPLSPKKVVAEIAVVLKSYGLDSAETDQWATDFIRDFARDEGFAIVEVDWSPESKWTSFKAFGERLSEGMVELSPVPLVAEDLKRVVKRTTQQGVTIVLPKTTDGRHCDYAPAVVMALARYLGDPVEEKPAAAEDTAVLERMKKRYASQKDVPLHRRRY